MSRNFCAPSSFTKILPGVQFHPHWLVFLNTSRFGGLESSRKLVISLLSLLRFLGRLVLEMCAPKHSIIFLFEHRLDSSEQIICHC